MGGSPFDNEYSLTLNKDRGESFNIKNQQDAFNMDDSH